MEDKRNDIGGDAGSTFPAGKNPGETYGAQDRDAREDNPQGTHGSFGNSDVQDKGENYGGSTSNPSKVS